MPTLLRAALQIAAKDLRVCLRDRQTVIYAVILPLAMYPVLFWVLLQAQSLIAGKRSAQELTLAVVATAEAEERLEGLLADLDLPGEDGLFETRAPELTSGSLADAARALFTAEEPPDVVLGVANASADESGLTVLFDGARARSTNGRDRLEAHLETTGAAAREAALTAAGTSTDDLEGLEYRAVDLASKEDRGAFAVSLMLPMMIVVMAVMGAFYPAIDLTAGETERGTEETTLLLPVPRSAVQLGKLLAVTAIGGMASAMNLVGMGLAAGHLLGMLGKGAIDFQLDLTSLVIVAPFVLVFVLFVSSILTAIASFADTFKQGQSLMGSAQMLFIFPAMASSLPGLTLTPGVAAIPVVGAAVAFRTVLRGGPVSELPWGGLALSALAMVAYAALAVVISVRLLNQELRSGGSVPVSIRLRKAIGLARPD